MTPADDRRNGEGAQPEPGAARFGALWLMLRFGLALWLLDLALAPLSPPWGPTVRGALSALLSVLVASAALGGALGALLWLARHPAYRAASGAPWAFFVPDGVDQLRARQGLVLATAPLLGGYALGSLMISERLTVGMARPELAALALLAAHLVLSGAVLLLLPAARSAGSWVALWLSRLPWVGPRCFATVRALVLWLLALLACAAAGFIYRYRAPLSYLPLRELAQGAAAAIGAGLLAALGRRLPEAVRRTGRVVFAALFVAAAGAALSLPATSSFSRHLGERAFLSGRLGHAALLLALDLDRDGHLPVLGGGDCAPLDATRHPGATDVPKNGVDEDCDGKDLDPKALPAFGEHRFAVPDTIPNRPPIVLLTVDAFAARALSALGGRPGVTPNLDLLAKRSALFTACFAQGPSTRLSFPSIFTSRWDSQIRQRLVGKHPYPIDPSELMLAEILDKAGYDTVAVLSDPYFARSRWSGITSGFTRVIETPFTDKPWLEHNAARVTDAAIAALAQQRRDPMFLWVHYYDAHSPHVQPKDAPVYGTSRHDVYAAELHYVDRELGRLLTEVQRVFGGQALVIVTGDHGIAFDEPRHVKFNYGYDLSTAVLHVPLMVQAPFIPARRLDGLVSTIDVTPTIVNLLRLRGAYAFAGVSLVPELLQGQRSRPPLLMHQMFLEERLWKGEDPLERVSVRTAEWNLIHERKDGFLALYHWRRDPYELRDLAADPHHEATLRELRQELQLLTFVASPPTGEGARK